MKFFIGTSSPYKITEIASILHPLGIPLEVSNFINPEETEPTFSGNAEIKVREYSNYVRNSLTKEIYKKGIEINTAEKHLYLNENYIISEDSGLVIPALSGLPGAYSARFHDAIIHNNCVIKVVSSGKSREEIDQLNIVKVLELMKDVPFHQRAAEFIVCLKVANIYGTIEFTSTAKSSGWILEGQKGDMGFGYDSIFANDRSFGKSWAEIDSMRKNLISHRRKVLQDFTIWLSTKLK